MEFKTILTLFEEVNFLKRMTFMFKINIIDNFYFNKKFFLYNNFLLVEILEVSDFAL